MIITFVSLEKRLMELIETRTGQPVLHYKNMEAAADKLPETEILLIHPHTGLDGIEQCRKLQWIYTMSAGVDPLPFEKLAAMGVRVVNASGIHGTQMAEHGLGLMIAFSRRLHDCIRNQQSRVWGRRVPVGELSGKTLLIVGAGRIGCELARKAGAFDMHILGLKRQAGPLPGFDAVWSMGRFHEALGLADYVVNLTPLTGETFHLFDGPAFEHMKSGAVFINMARGDTVDEAALIQALRAGRLGGAGLDVFHQEPLPPENELWGFENVIITPHIAGIVPDYFDRAVGKFLESYERIKKGEGLDNLVDLQRRY